MRQELYFVVFPQPLLDLCRVSITRRVRLCAFVFAFFSVLLRFQKGVVRRAGCDGPIPLRFSHGI